MALIDLTGLRYGRLCVLGPGPRQGEAKKSRFTWRCICDCGTRIIVRGDGLKAGTSSCGCYRKERALKANKTHGQTAMNSPEYRTWQNIKQRCVNKNKRCYKNYGEKGISVCPEWENSFETFLKDMGPKPSSKHSIEREKNEMGYSKLNCRWATREIQNRNHSRNIKCTYNGRTLVLADWAKELNVGQSTLKYHLRNGEPFNKIYETFKGSDYVRYDVKAIYCATLDMGFKSAKETVHMLGSTEDHIHMVCRGIKNQINGLYYRYIK